MFDELVFTLFYICKQYFAKLKIIRCSLNSDAVLKEGRPCFGEISVTHSQYDIYICLKRILGEEYCRRICLPSNMYEIKPR